VKTTEQIFVKILPELHLWMSDSVKPNHKGRLCKMHWDHHHKYTTKCWW